MNIPSPKIDLMLISLINKYYETIDNTIFEFMNISECKTLSKLKESYFDISIKRCNTDTIISLHNGKKHIITYRIYVDLEEGKVKRSRKVNDV